MEGLMLEDGAIPPVRTNARRAVGQYALTGKLESPADRFCGQPPARSALRGSQQWLWEFQLFLRSMSAVRAREVVPARLAAPLELRGVGVYLFAFTPGLLP